MGTTVAEIRALLRAADAEEFAVLERSLVADSRKGVQAALQAARRRLEAQASERDRLLSMYSFESEVVSQRGGTIAIGLDEVGRGPLAGPLAVGAVVLPAEPMIEGLNDSKQVHPDDRERIATEIRRVALAWAVEYVEPAMIDECGMAACLRKAFSCAISAVESQGVVPDVVLIDGNPLHVDEREVNLVKGDARCASIAAASIIAKVDRDALMCRYALEYPEYGFAANKGYASPDHIAAIRRVGLSPIHRASFCSSFSQESLF